MPRPADRRAKIELLRAAEAVFVEHGLAAAKVEDITAQAGVSKGAFYLHFESKDDCFRQIVEVFLAKLATCLDDAPPSRPIGDAAALGALLADWRTHDLEMLDFCWQNRGLMRLLFSGAGGAPYAYLMDEFSERVSHQIQSVAGAMIEAGLYRPDVDPVILAALISGAYERLVREMIKQPKRPDIEGATRQAQELFARGLLSDEARAVLDRMVSHGEQGGHVGHEQRRGPRESGPGLVREGEPRAHEGRRKKAR